MSGNEDEATRIAELESDSSTVTFEAANPTTVPGSHGGKALSSATYRSRGVDWVRPTELIARSGSRMAGTGLNFQSELHRRTREATTTSIRGIAMRARRLPPVSAFGRGTSNPEQSAAQSAPPEQQKRQI